MACSRTVRMSAHVDRIAQKHVIGVQGMQRIDLGVLGAIEVVNIVALDGLI